MRFFGFLAWTPHPPISRKFTREGSAVSIERFVEIRYPLPLTICRPAGGRGRGLVRGRRLGRVLRTDGLPGCWLAVGIAPGTVPADPVGGLGRAVRVCPGAGSAGRRGTGAGKPAGCPGPAQPTSWRGRCGGPGVGLVGLVAGGADGMPMALVRCRRARGMPGVGSACCAGAGPAGPGVRGAEFFRRLGRAGWWSGRAYARM